MGSAALLRTRLFRVLPGGATKLDAGTRVMIRALLGILENCITGLRGKR